MAEEQNQLVELNGRVRNDFSELKQKIRGHIESEIKSIQDSYEKKRELLKEEFKTDMLDLAESEKIALETKLGNFLEDCRVTSQKVKSGNMNKFLVSKYIGF